MMVFLFSGFSVMAQMADAPEINPKDPAFRQKYENIDLKGKFSTQVLNDQTNNYYVVDFSGLKEKYDKVFFLSLVFQDGKVVNIDSDLAQDRIWFLSNVKYAPSEINGLFIKLKEKTIKSSSLLSDEQKAAWLLENDKYK
jgi:hypothetical protein